MRKNKLPKDYILTRVNLEHHYFTVIYYKNTLVYIDLWRSLKNFNRKCYNKYRKDLKKEEQKAERDRELQQLLDQERKRRLKHKEKIRKKGYITEEDIEDISPLYKHWYYDTLQIGDDVRFLKYNTLDDRNRLLEILINKYENNMLDKLYYPKDLKQFLTERRRKALIMAKSRGIKGVTKRVREREYHRKHVQKEKKE